MIFRRGAVFRASFFYVFIQDCVAIFLDFCGDGVL